MEHLLEELWDSYCLERFCKASKEQKRLIGELADKEQALLECLDEVGRTRFKEYDACVGTLYADVEREAFITGVRFAAAFLRQISAHGEN